ncbi:MAG: imidazole glycerol phosphate synthase subunit HisH [Chlamydiota bacterium]|nr:imidazole glycerol phosphate synthase subunit HisH [Chlamydiota bacterium]
MRIVIVDYGMGNLKSVEKAFEFLGYSCEVTQDPSVVNDAEKLVLPGVGAFGDCMGNLKTLGLYDAIIKFARSERPFLGICLGLQTLFEVSVEGGSYPGFGLIPGSVVKFEHQMKIPHMGWNRIEYSSEKTATCPLLQGIPDGSYMYFVHSYFVLPSFQDVVATKTDYGVSFASMIWKDNIFAVQFHPEKSQDKGLLMLDNFAKI